MLLHGFTGSRHSFDHLERLLGSELVAECVELPGHHEAPADSFQDFESVVDALASRIEGRTNVIGYSQGARLALALAVRYPAKVERLVLESGSPGLRRRHDRVLRRRADESLATLIESEGVQAFIQYWEQLPIFSGIRALPRPIQAELRQRRVAHTPAGLAAALRLMGQGAQPNLWSSLPTLRIPTLIISGSADIKYTRIAKRMGAEIPLAWRVAIRSVGHAPHLEAPQAFVAELKAFLESTWTHELDFDQEVTR
jgi:2-succinyl-6-hydroxy-2,4-cyclohexadiene-1-carboxylate synthase